MWKAAEQIGNILNESSFANESSLISMRHMINILKYPQILHYGGEG